MSDLLIRNVRVVNEGDVKEADILIKNGRIEKIAGQITPDPKSAIKEFDGKGDHLFPGCIDDQVHFREPGLTHKADIHTESRAAVAGGITSFMEMPNTVPNTLTQELLEEKYKIGAARSIANYSFYMGVSNDNAEEVLRTDPEEVCGIKIFMGSSTGNMLVDDKNTLERVFGGTQLLIATHCEDEGTIKRNLDKVMAEFGEDIDTTFHPKIRSEEACYLSSSYAVDLAKRTGARLHVLHISTAKELGLFSNDIPLKEKRITAEACIHHLWFDSSDYERFGNLIKWNPAVKEQTDQQAIRQAVINDTIDVIATDHAPHTLEEKQRPYLSAPSGGPLVQHSLPVMLEFHREGWMPLEHIAKKMAHDVADCFRIVDRGYIREGYFADLALVDLNGKTSVENESLLYKCGWSPFEGFVFSSSVCATWVNGKMVYSDGRIVESGNGMRMKFERDR
jgi:dihydroorotase